MSGTGGSTGGSQFTISLKDETSRASVTAGQALANLKKGIDADIKSLRNMQAAMSRLKGGASKDEAVFKSLRAQIAAQKNQIAESQAQFLNLGGNLDDTGEKASTFGDRLAEGMDKAKSPTQLLSAAMAALPPQAQIVLRTIGAGIGIMVAFAAAVLAAAAALARLALASADARRSEMLHLEGLTTLRNVYGIAAGSASDLANAIDHVSDSSALSRGEISGMAESLYRAGLRGANLADTLEGLSIAQSVQGDRGAARFRALAVSIARTGGSVRRLTDDYRTRLGGIASRQALGLDRQMEHLRESVGRIFGDVRIEGFLHGLHTVIQLFSQSTVTGRALHQLATVIFSPFFDSVGDGAPTVVNFLQDVVIGVQRIVIAVLRAAVTVHNFQRAFSDAGGVKAIQRITGALSGLSAVLETAGFSTFEASVTAIVPGLSAVFNTIRLLRVEIEALFRISSAGPAAGTALGDGLARGIRASMGLVRSAGRALGLSAEDGARDALEVHSPSRVFARLGAQVPRGFAQGVDHGASAASEAVVGMSDAAIASASGEQAGARSSAAGARSITVGDVHLHLARGGEEEGRSAARAFLEELATALEGSAIEMGAT